MKSACYMDAMLCAELSGDWKGVLQIAKKAEMSDADLAVKLEKVTLLLEKKKKYGQCVELLLHLGRSVSCLYNLLASRPFFWFLQVIGAQVVT